MASPNGEPASTPSQSSRQKRKYPHEHTPSPRRPNDDSPSRQLMLELSLQTVEQRRKFYEKLDRQSLEREQIHLRALNAAAAEHDRVRRNAQLAQELLQLELERRRQQEENEQMKAIDQEKQELIDREIAAQRRAIEESRRLAEKEKAAAQAKVAAEEAERNRREQQAQDEEEAAAKAALSAPTAPPPQKSAASVPPPLDRPPDKQPTPAKQDAPSVLPSQPDPSHTSSPREAEHARFLQLHKSLKTMRANMISQSKVKGNETLKARMGEMRRAIRKSVGQLTADPATRRAPLRNIRLALNEALQDYPTPTIDPSPYILSQPLPQSNPQHQMPALLLYLLNIFSKSVISQFISESGADPKTADPIGIVAISIFAHKDYKLAGETSLIDLLLAKIHLVCPVLFGITGSEGTEPGRLRLGWRRDPETNAWVSEQRHTERMTGLGSGFAALSLRNFQNSSSINPYPPSHFWRAIAGILNTPSAAVTQTHCTVLRAMIEFHAPRFIAFYGAAAVAVLRMAAVEFPTKAPKGAAASALATLAATFRRELHLTL